MKKILLSLALVVCIMLSLMPLAYASPDVSIKYINVTAWQGEEPTEIELSETKNENTAGIFINSNIDVPYTLDEDASGLILLINNVDVTIGEGVGFGDFRIAGSGSLDIGPVTISPGSYTTPFDGDASNAGEVIGFFKSDAFEGTDHTPGATYSFTVTDDFTLEDGLDAYSLSVNEGKTFTQNSIINARFVSVDGFIHIGASDNPTVPNGLNIEDGGSLTVGTGGSITADDGQILEIRSGASVSGITLYNPDGTEYTGGFEYTETFCYNAGESRWERQDPGNPGGVGNNEYRIHYDESTGGKVSLNEQPIDAGAIYSFTENEEIVFELTPPEGVDAPYMISVRQNGGEETEITNYSNGQFTYTPQNSNGFEIDIFWTEEEYEYFRFGGTTEKPIVVEAVFNGNGSVTFPESIPEGDRVAGGNREKVRVSESTESIEFTWDENEAPTQIRVEGAGTDGDWLDIDDPQGSSYTLQLDQNKHFYCIEFRFEDGGDPGPGPGIPDNRYVVHFDRNNDAAVSVNDTTVVDSDGTEETQYSFTVGMALAVALTPPEGTNGDPVVIVRRNNGEEENISSTLTCTPSDAMGFEIYVYWTQGEYEFYTFGASENEIMVQFGWFREGTVTVQGEKQITYGNRTKVAVDNSTDHIAFIIIPNDGGNPAHDLVEVVKDGNERFSKQDLMVGGYYDEGSSVLSIPLESNISNYYLEFYFSENPGGDHDPGDPGQDHSTDYEGAMRDIPEHGYAYYVDTTQDNAADILKNYLATEIWYEYFGNFENNKRPYYGMFNSIEYLKAAITLGDFVSEDDPLPYYSYSVRLSEDVSANGEVYVLSSRYEFIVKIGNTYNVVDTSEVSGENNDIYVSGNGNVSVFGNGTCPVGKLETGDQTLKAKAAHITQEHSGLENDEVIGGINCRLAVFPEDYVGARIVGGTKAAAWGFVEVPVFAAGSDGSPAIAEIYHGNDGSSENRKITIYTIMDSRGENPNGEKTVAGIALDTRYISSSAADIKQVQGGFEITFNTSYDEIPLVITYGDDSKGYITIHRVGLNLAEGTVNAQTRKFTVWHGTDGTQHYTLQGSDTHVVTAEFYYATGNVSPDGSQRVSLSVTVTMADGTVTRKIIQAGDSLNGPQSVYVSPGPTAALGEDNHCDDFLVWSGTEEEYNNLQKVEVIAFIAGDDNTFGGVKVGSGTGVMWTRPEN